MRFYTYASTMLLCLEAAADAGVELVVLDRPEPARAADALTGRAATRDRSVPLVWSAALRARSCTASPLGEMARVRQRARERSRRALTVVPMEGWSARR